MAKDLGSMTYRSALGAGSLAAMLLASGCYIQASTRTRATTRSTAAPPSGNGGANARGSITISGGQPTVSEGVTVVETTCVQGGQEACNGLDDNCNGQIDEGCGYQSGDMQFTLAWQNGADLDMHLYGPGMHLYYAEAEALGGHLDKDDRGTCVSDGNDQSNVENIYWQGQEPPSGSYRVNVTYYDDCHRQNGPTAFTVQAVVGGQVYGPYQYTATEEQEVDVFTFDL